MGENAATTQKILAVFDSTRNRLFFMFFLGEKPPFQSILNLNWSRAAQHHFAGLEAVWECFSKKL